MALRSAVMGRIKNDWRLFERSQPGRRFRERYRRRQRQGRGWFDPTRFLYITIGVALIFASALIGWLPVFGWGTAFLGLGMVAGEFLPAARLMDWLEVKARKFLVPLGRRFAKLPPWAQLLISVLIAALTFALVFGMYRATLGG